MLPSARLDPAETVGSGKARGIEAIGRSGCQRLVADGVGRSGAPTRRVAVRQPTRELAYAAAGLLFDAPGEIVHRRLPHELVLRASTAPPGT